MRSVLTVLLILFGLGLYAQVTEVGSGGVKRAALGPMNGDTLANSYGRFAYLYPQSVLGNIQHGDSIVSIAFKQADNPVLMGSSSFKIYLKTTGRSDFGSSSLNWSAEVRDQMTLVYSSTGTIPLPYGLGFASFKFNAVDYFRYDTTNGTHNLQVLIESTHASAQQKPMGWFFENGTTVPGLVSNFGTKYVSGTGALDSICGNSSILRPTMRLLYPRDSNDIYLYSSFTPAVVPVVAATDQEVLVHLVNAGLNAVSGQDIYAQSIGANKLNDTLELPVLQSGEEYLARFTNLNPLFQGSDIVNVSSSDSKGENNTKQSARQVSYNQYSHIPLNTPSTAFYQEIADSAQYALKFKANGQVRLDSLVYRVNSIGVPYQIVVWNAGVDGKPGSIIYRSSTLSSSPGTATYQFPTVTVQNEFFVGFIQTTAAPLKLNVVEYSPLIPKHIYSKKGVAAWRDFSTRENLAFFAELTVKPPNDLKLVEIIGLSDNDSIPFNPADSLSFGVRIANLGYLLQQDFDVSFYLVNTLGDTVYGDTVSASLAANDSSSVFFNPVANSFLGRFKLYVTVNSSFDPVIGNNTQRLDLVYVADVDLALNYSFEPWYNDTFIVNQQRFAPLIRVINLGATKVSDFLVVVQLKQGDVILAADTQTTSLSPGFSQILSFDSLAVTVPGDLDFIAYVEYSQDTFSSNDSLVIPIFGKLIRDVSVDSSLSPLPNDRFLVGSTIQPFGRVSNNGIQNQNNFFLKLHVIKNNEIVFRDSSTVSLQHGAQEDFALKSFAMNTLGVYTLRYIVYSSDDQYRANDTLDITVRSVRNNDIQLVRFVVPGPNEKIERNETAIRPQVVVNNPGFIGLTSIPFFAVIATGEDTVYRDTVLADISSGSLDTIQFVRPFALDQWGAYQISVRHAHADEVDFDAGDTLDGRFVIANRKDLSLLSVITPVNQDSLVLGGVVNTKIKLANVGIQTLNDITIAYHILDDSDRVVLQDTLNYTALASEDSINLQADTFFRPATTGRFNVVVYSIVPDDSVSNDTISHVFFVYKPLDLLIAQTLLPTVNDSLTIHSLYAPGVSITNDGIYDADVVTVDCRVLVNDEVIYNKAKLVAVKASETLEVKFDSSLSYTEVSQAKVRFSVIAQGDNYNANDSVWVDFNFVKNNASLTNFEQAITVYPNPFNTAFTVVMPSRLKRLIVFNSFGENVYEEENLGHSADIVLSGASGLYILQVDTEEGTVYYKVLKR